MSDDNANRLAALARQLEASDKSAPKRRGRGELIANPVIGDRGEFLKRTIMISPELDDLLLKEVKRRQRANMRNATLTAVIREALVDWFKRQQAK